MTNLLRLAQLLLRERWRKLRNDRAWPANLSTGLLLLVGAAVSVYLLRQNSSRWSPEQIGAVSNQLITAWIVAGVLLGKDLTWHTPLNRLTLFPLSFSRLYGLALGLGFLTYPVLLALCALEGSFLQGNAAFTGGVQILAGFCLGVCSVRLAVSLARTALYRSSALRSRLRYLLWLVIVPIAAAAITPLTNPGAGYLLPGYRYGLILLGVHPFKSLFLMALPVALLTLVDYAVQREIAYSGFAGPAARLAPGTSKARFLLFKPSRSATLWRISLLGWIRHRNAVVGLIWGGAYGFTYMFLSKPEREAHFIAFIWMVLILHGYLRGNLLGVDNRAVWLYYMFPVPLDSVVKAKNSTLTALQMSMAGAVVLPAVLRRTSAMTTGVEWIGVLSFTCCGVLLGEIVGSVFSVLHPRPIDRSSMYSGGTTPGALLVPLIQTAVLAIVVFAGALAQRFLGTPLALALFVLAPAALWAVRNAVLHFWVRKRMLRRKSTILRKLMTI